MTEHTATPWSVSADGKAIMGENWQRFVIYAAAFATCGKEPGDYYACTNAKAESVLHMKPGDAAFIVKAVNSHDALVEALRGFIDILEGAQSGFMPLCGSDRAWMEGRDSRIADARDLLASVGSAGKP